MLLCCLAVLINCSAPVRRAPLDEYQGIAWRIYKADKMGVSSSADDYSFTEGKHGAVVTVEIAPKQFEDDHFGGKGRFGFDVRIYIDLRTRKVLRKEIGS